MKISKQDVGLDIEQLELASRVALSEAAKDQRPASSVDDSKDSSSSSETETSSDSDDDDVSDDTSSSSDSFVVENFAAITDRSEADCFIASSSNADGVTCLPVTVMDSLLVTENNAVSTTCATDTLATTKSTAAEPADAVCVQLSSLTVTDDEQHVTSVVSELPQSNVNIIQQ